MRAVCRSLLGRRGAFSSLRRARQGKLMSIVDQAVEDRIGDRRVAQGNVPFGSWELAGDDRGACRVAVFQGLQHVLTLALFEHREAPVVEHEDVARAKWLIRVL